MMDDIIHSHSRFDYTVYEDNISHLFYEDRNFLEALVLGLADPEKILAFEKIAKTLMKNNETQFINYQEEFLLRIFDHLVPEDQLKAFECIKNLEDIEDFQKRFFLLKVLKKMEHEYRLDSVKSALSSVYKTWNPEDQEQFLHDAFLLLPEETLFELFVSIQNEKQNDWDQSLKAKFAAEIIPKFTERDLLAFVKRGVSEDKVFPLIDKALAK